MCNSTSPLDHQENSNGEIIKMGPEGSEDLRKGHQSEVKKE